MNFYRIFTIQKSGISRIGWQQDTGEVQSHENANRASDRNADRRGGDRVVFRLFHSRRSAGQDFPAFDPDSQGTKPNADQSPADLVAEFARLRTASLDAVAQITMPDLNRQARHAELGMVTLGELVHEWAAHDLMHTVQAERALMQPFIRGCGPWLPYFADHVAKQS